jgi:hypothetical protein
MRHGLAPARSAQRLYQRILHSGRCSAGVQVCKWLAAFLTASATLNRELVDSVTNRQSFAPAFSMQRLYQHPQQAKQ